MSDKKQTYTILHADHPGDKNDYKVFNNTAAANKGWKDLMNKAVDMAAQQGMDFLLRQYSIEVEEGTDPDSLDAKNLIKDGSAIEDRWTRIRAPSDFSKLIKKTGPGVVTKKIIEEAQEIINEKAEEFPQWAREDMRTIEAKLHRLQASIKDNKDDVADIKAELFNHYYVLRGQGGTFNFDLVTTGCALSCQLLDSIPKLRLSDIQSLHVILDGIKLILRQPELRENAPVCAALSQGFSDVVTKALNPKKK